MPLANRFNDIFKDFEHDTTDFSFEGVEFLRRGFLRYGLDAFIHLTVSA